MRLAPCSTPPAHPPRCCPAGPPPSPTPAPSGTTLRFAASAQSSDGRAGRLEALNAGVWGTVCDDYFTDVAAKVACAQINPAWTATNTVAK